MSAYDSMYGYMRGYGPQPGYAGNYTNYMDMASDAYGSSGIPNAGGQIQNSPNLLGYVNGADMSSDMFTNGGGLLNAGGLVNGQSYGLLDKMGDGLGSLFKGAIGTREAPGWGGLAMSAIGGAANTFMGMKQYGLAKDMFEENKRVSAQNFAVQGGLTNARLNDRQVRRNIERPDSMAAVDYMSKYGVKV